MITKLLDGLEMFLGVGVMFLNSSNSKMAEESCDGTAKLKI